MTNFHLIPQPKSIKETDGLWQFNGGYIAIDSRDLYDQIVIARNTHFAECEIVVGKYAHIAPAISVEKGDGLQSEGYTLTITADGVVITYADARGAFYAFMTLNQIMASCTDKTVPCLTIEDWPSLPLRGYMLDISRNKVPKTEEILKLIDKLASLKINHLELYMEWVPFTYPSFPQMWQGLDLLHGEDILVIDRYCRERLIELAPNQNNFGHMDRWLLKEFRHLAECPEGFKMGESTVPPRCLNPLHPGSEKLISDLADDLLPYFTSNLYNVCCDETIELGRGESKELCEKIGKGRVYLEFLKKVLAIAKKHGKRSMIWDDIIMHYPELLSELPEDIIVLEWNYGRNGPTAERCEQLQKAGMTYLVCPAVHGWNSFLSKSDEMYGNMITAAKNGVKYGAAGFLNTDWGDGGHLNFISTSYVGIAWGAAMSWGPDENEHMDMKAAIDKHIYRDQSGSASQFVLECGHFFELEGHQPTDNTTLSHRFFMTGLKWRHLCEGLSAEAFDLVADYLAERRALLEKMDFDSPEGDLIKEEFRLNLEVVILLQNVGRFYVANHTGDKELRVAALKALQAGIPPIIEKTRELWLIRNRYSYLDDSVGPWHDLLADVEKELAAL